MNDNQGSVDFLCPRCGNEVKGTARYCMKCGYLNPNHPQNKQYAKFNNVVEQYNVSDGTTNSATSINTNEVRGKNFEISFGSNVGNYTLCFIINFVLYVILNCGIIGFFYSTCSGNIQMMLCSAMPYVLFVFSLLSIYMYSIQLVYMKMNRPWWDALIPFYNMYVLSDTIYHKTLFNILVFIPIVGEIYLLVLLYKMGEAFKVNGILMMLIPFIMFPVIGFGGQSFNNVFYVSGKDSLEKEYGKKKAFLVTSVIIIVVSIISVVYANIVDINQGIDRFSSYYLYFASKRVIRRTKLKVENQVYECKGSGDVLYFYYSDLQDYFNIPFYVFRDPIEAYVKVQIVRDESGDIDHYDYYISMTDAKYGYSEIPVDNLEIFTVSEYPALDPGLKSGNQC